MELVLAFAYGFLGMAGALIAYTIYDWVYSKVERIQAKRNKKRRH